MLTPDTLTGFTILAARRRGLRRLPGFPPRLGGLYRSGVIACAPQGRNKARRPTRNRPAGYPRL
jgi:hypothetical protein